MATGRNLLRTPSLTVSSKRDRVYGWLKSLGAKNKIVSGQMSWSSLVMTSINTKYGNCPGLRGFDWFAQADPTLSDDIIAWDAQGGLTTLMYHMPNPFYGNAQYNAVNSSGNWANLITSGTTENTNFRATLDVMAATLTNLQSKKIIVLFRPFHEMNGNWFWWGLVTSQSFINTWQYMHDYFTVTKGLKNLLWVYSPNAGTGNLTALYPGDAYVDVVALDCYNYSTFQYWDDYEELTGLTAKPFAISEFGAGSPNGLPAGGVSMTAFPASLPSGTIYWMNWESGANGNFGLDQNNVGTATIFSDTRVLTLNEIYRV